MSKRHEILDHLRALQDISGILGAMKNLALMEMHKLARFLSAQRRVVGSIEKAAEDFFSFQAAALARETGTIPAYVAIGSERGFCGDFNEAIVAAVAEQRRADADDQTLVIAIGHKLAEKLEQAGPLTASLPGPSVTEEVQPVLLRLIETLRDLQSRQKPGCTLDLTILAHGSGEDGLGVQVRRPFHQEFHAEGIRLPFPPLLNLDPLTFLTGLMDQYLFAVLHETFYSSFMAENRRRFQHMDQAIQRLDRETDELSRRHHVLRQEDITEEIAVIMLSAEVVQERR